MQSCTGNSEALLRSANPGVEDIILDLLPLEYSEVVMFGRVPQLDAYDRPIWACGTCIHDKCERRGNFDAGEFVQSWADLEGLKRGYCHYKVGCKGPFTYNNCGGGALQPGYLLNFS